MKLENIIKERILVLDGGMGTLLHKKKLTSEDFGGDDYEGCPEMLNIIRPEIIKEIHDEYLKSGSDIIETNTFGGSPLVLSEYGLSEKIEELNNAAVKIAKSSAQEFSTPEKPRFVAASIGPSTKSFSVTGGITFEELEENFYKQAHILISAKPDLIIFETAVDTVNVKSGLIGINRAKSKLNSDIPVVLSISIEKTGTMLAGQGVEALLSSVEHMNLFSIGLNCSTGPDFMTDHLRTISTFSGSYVNICPNAGMPDSNGQFELSAEEFIKSLEYFMGKSWVNIVGGCCGTTPEFIKGLSKVAPQYTPRKIDKPIRKIFSGLDLLEVRDEVRPIIVGERTNVHGSRIFKNLIIDEKFDEATEIARRQTKNGAQVIDICLGNPDRNELSDMVKFVNLVKNKVKVTIMIDSTDEKVIEESLKQLQGKSIINSINLENGEERFQKIVPIANKYGAGLVVGMIDDDPNQGMGITCERKIEIAKRSYKLLVEKYKVEPGNIIFDPLVFPVGTGDKKYESSAIETIEALKQLKELFPETSTILGVSNVSFGLPLAGREVLNSIFLYHSTKAGLDFALVNSEKIKKFSKITEEERKLTEDLLFFRGDDPINKFVEFYKDKKVQIVESKTTLSVEDRLVNYVVEGSKDGLINDLNEALKTYSPIDVLNKILMRGMEIVGKLFNENKLIVIEVLESAETMNAAVVHLGQFMDGDLTKSSIKGRVLLATVKGDVHDIGKNLVNIILTNNGFKVIDLGIKVSSETLIDVQKKENANAICLSGLLVKSAWEMAKTAEDLKRARVTVPIIVGGAALTKKFTETEIKKMYYGSVYYANDAMNALLILNELDNDDQTRKIVLPKNNVSSSLCEPNQKIKREFTVSNKPSKRISPPPIPINEIVIKKSLDLKNIFSYINPLMLYGKHLGLTGDLQKKSHEGDKKAKGLLDFITSLQIEIIEKKMIQPMVMYKFFPVLSNGDVVKIYSPEDPSKQIDQFTFPRQPEESGLSISDYILPESEGEKDQIAIMVTSAGKGIKEIAGELRGKGEYLRSHAISALAIETAEALAEFTHQKIRELWGFPDSAQTTKKDLFKGKYRGLRYSFGYPACPDLEQQKNIFNLLKPELIDIKLTDGYMMDPEASISAIVLHHPEAKYFKV